MKNLKLFKNIVSVVLVFAPMVGQARTTDIPTTNDVVIPADVQFTIGAAVTNSAAAVDGARIAYQNLLVPEVLRNLVTASTSADNATIQALVAIQVSGNLARSVPLTNNFTVSVQNLENTYKLAIDAYNKTVSVDNSLYNLTRPLNAEVMTSIAAEAALTGYELTQAYSNAAQVMQKIAQAAALVSEVISARASNNTSRVNTLVNTIRVLMNEANALIVAQNDLTAKANLNYTRASDIINYYRDLPPRIIDNTIITDNGAGNPSSGGGGSTTAGVISGPFPVDYTPPGTVIVGDPQAYAGFASQADADAFFAWYEFDRRYQCTTFGNCF